ncbi:MAG: family 43 glycosylhydrolase [Oscillospiraceae bacterium]|nr:family 43 glycosylhydrolase [Oscillospiraceae bacterium]
MEKQVFNPYLPSWEYIPDGEPHVFGERVYVYGSHDKFNGHAYCLNDYVCWSAPVNDLSDWRYEGVIYQKTSDPENNEGDGCLFAPDVTKGLDGRYYLYYVLDKLNIVSVAVCDTPAGRYEFLGCVHYKDGTRLGEREGDEPQFDPAVLTEGDKIYLYTGFCPIGDKSRHGPMCTVLAPDMLTVEEAPVFIAPSRPYSNDTPWAGHEFFEAPSIRKKGDTYYFVYSSAVYHELCYATSKSPTKDFVYRGVIISNCDMHIHSYKPAGMPMYYGSNNHGGMAEINGLWYIFYHRHTNGHNFSRQGCAEPIAFREDGSIVQSEMTSCGLNGKPLSGKGEYPAYICCNLFCKDEEIYVPFGGAWMDSRFPKVTQDGKDGDKEDGYVQNMCDTATAGYKYFECESINSVSVTTRGYAKGLIEVKTGWNGKPLGEIPVGFSAVWKENVANIYIPDGKQAIYFTFRGSGNISLKSFKLL